MLYDVFYTEVLIFRVNLMAFWCTAATVSLFCWLSISGPAGLLVWGGFYGFFSGVFVSVSLTLSVYILALTFSAASTCVRSKIHRRHVQVRWSRRVCLCHKQHYHSCQCAGCRRYVQHVHITAFNSLDRRMFRSPLDTRQGKSDAMITFSGVMCVVGAVFLWAARLASWGLLLVH